MKINNRKRVAKVKRVFFMVSVLIAIAALVFLLFDLILAAIICAGVFSLWYLYFHVADYQYVEFSDENERILLRYYKAISLGKPNYNEIAFPKEMLRKAVFEDSMFGELSDITLVVKTKKGIAEYPSVSLSAVNKNERQKMSLSLNHLIQQQN